MSSPRNIINEENETQFTVDLEDGELSAPEEPSQVINQNIIQRLQYLNNILYRYDSIGTGISPNTFNFLTEIPNQLTNQLINPLPQSIEQSESTEPESQESESESQQPRSNLHDFNLEMTTTDTFNRLLQSTFYDKTKYKHVLSDKGEENLEEITYSLELNTNNVCPIFQTDFSNGMQVIKLPCNHCFTPEAIKKWLKEIKAECPVCRHSLDSKEIESEETQPSTLDNQRNLYYSLQRTQIPSILNTIFGPQTTNNYVSSSDISLEPPATRRRITFNNIMSDILNNQQEEDLQRAIINSLTNTS